MKEQEQTNVAPSAPEPTASKVTFQEYASGISPVVAAGVAVMLRAEKGARKRTEAEWASVVEAFLRAPAH